MSNTLFQTAAYAPPPSITRHGLGWTLAAAALLGGCQQLPQPPVYTTPALTAQPPRIDAGQSVRLSWDAPLGNSLRMSGLTATPPGAVLVRPAQTTTYTLSGPAPSGAPISASVTVEVQPPEAPLARLQMGAQPTGDSIGAGFLGLTYDAVQLQQLMGATAAGPASASYGQLLRNLQNYGGGPLSLRIEGDNRMLAQARQRFAGLPAGTVTLEGARGAGPCPAVEQLERAPAPRGGLRCTLGEPPESALATADTLLDYAQRGLAGVQLQGGIWNTAAAPPAVEPRYYGMLFFAQFAAAQGQWLPMQVDSSARIKAWAVRDARNQSVRVAVINHEASTSGTVALQLPDGLRQAVVTRLTSSEPLRLAGQTFDGSRDGRPVGTAYGEILEADSSGQLLLAMGAASAALLTLTPQ